jgi:NAD(P)-dependent dehydrogenase (short-subunit alcohol dehydrogenase family)
MKTMSKTVLITGSTDGIGKLTALKMANEGHEVYIHGRNPEKVKNTIEELKEKTNNSKIKGFVADLSDLDSVKKLAAQVKQEITSLDVLVNNAGVYVTPQVLNKDGLDLRFAVNYLAPYLLTKELLPILEKTENPRIINLSSAAQSGVSMEILRGDVQSSTGDTYAQSKLALIMWSFKLAQELSGISVIAVNPGSLLNTRMVKEAFGRHWSSPDKGASILYDLSLSKEYDGANGKYFDNDMGGFNRAHPEAYDQGKTDLLIQETEKILNK